MATDFGWRKSSFSGNDSNCVELAWLGVEIAIRDSKHPAAGHLSFPAPALRHLSNLVSDQGRQH